MHSIICRFIALAFCTLLGAMFWAPPSYADSAACPGLSEAAVNAVSNQLHPQLALSGYACKALPDEAGKVMLLLPYPAPCDAQDTGKNCRDLELVLLSKDGLDIASHLFQKTAWNQDACGTARGSVDTAKYPLHPRARAFGVRVVYSGAVQFDSACSIEELSLYEIQNEAIVLRLQNLEVLSSAQTRGAAASGACEQGRSLERRRSLAVAKTSKHGYADLLVKEASLKTDYRPKPGANLGANPGANPSPTAACSKTESKKGQQFVLRFDGQKYLPPAGK